MYSYLCLLSKSHPVSKRLLFQSSLHSQSNHREVLSVIIQQSI